MQLCSLPWGCGSCLSRRGYATVEPSVRKPPFLCFCAKHQLRSPSGSQVIMPQILTGCRVIVTGASRGIGRATALALAHHGAKLVLVARRSGPLQEVADQVEVQGGTASVVSGDVAQAGTMQAAVENCLNRYGGLDVVINNAGSGLFATIEQTEEPDLDAMWVANVKSVFGGIRAALPVMRRQGVGHIINVASTAGRRGSPYVGAYCASKFAVVGLTESLRTELLGSGIRVSLVCPGATRTSFFDAAVRRTDRHAGLVGPVESAEAVARRIVKLIRHPKAEDVAQPFRRKLFFIANILVPSVVDRFLAWKLGVRAERRSSA